MVVLALAYSNPWSSASFYLLSQSLADSRCNQGKERKKENRQPKGGRARWRDLRGRARSVRAPPPPAPPRPHATAKALRPSVTCNLERLVCRLHRCAVTSVCRLRQMVCHPPPHTAQRTTLRPTGARLSPCRTKNSQHNTQQVLVFSPLIQRTGNKKKKVVLAAFPHFSSY